MLKLGISLMSHVAQTARLARGVWNRIIDTWQNETRKWEEII